MGTVAYMSPEQARGEALDARADLFSFGTVLYEMATGRPAFTGNTAAVIHDAVLNRDPTPPTRWNSDLPADLERAISRSLEKDRELRYQTAAELRADLKRVKRDSESTSAASTLVIDPPARAAGEPAAGRAGTPAAGSVGEPGVRRVSGRRWLLVGAIGAALILAAVL